MERRPELGKREGLCLNSLKRFSWISRRIFPLRAFLLDLMGGGGGLETLQGHWTPQGEGIGPPWGGGVLRKTVAFTAGSNIGRETSTRIG